METVYFLIFIGACAFAVVWLTRRSKSDTDLAARKERTKFAETDTLLKTPANHRLSRKEDLWEERRNSAKQGIKTPGKFVPKFEEWAESQYDGYSRRDRHHVTSTEHVKKEAHVDDADEFAMPGAGSAAKEHASRT